MAGVLVRVADHLPPPCLPPPHPDQGGRHMAGVLVRVADPDPCVCPPPP